MKKVLAVFLCVLAACVGVFGAQGTSILAPKTIEEALTWKIGDGQVCVVIGAMTDEVVDVRQYGVVKRMDVQQVIYGNVTKVNLLQMIDTMGEIDMLPTGESFLFLLKPAETSIENEYHRVGAWYGQFFFANGQLYGSRSLVDEILADDPSIDTMDELVHYFEKRIDALQREGKLPPDPVDWPGLLCAAGGLMLLGGLTVILVYRRRRG